MEATTETKVNNTKPRIKNIMRAAAALVVLAAAGTTVWYFFIRTPAGPQNLIKVSGRIEGDDATVSSKVSGRLRELTVREGDQVKVGQVIAIIDDAQVRAREEQELSKVREAQARATSASQQISVLEAQLEQS